MYEDDENEGEVSQKKKSPSIDVGVSAKQGKTKVDDSSSQTGTGEKSDKDNNKSSQTDQQGEKQLGNNIGYRTANDLKNFSGKAEKLSNKLGDKSQKFTNKAAEQAQFASQHAGTKAGNVAAVKAQKLQAKAESLKKASEKTMKIAAKAKKFAQVAAFIGKIIAIAGLIILGIMIIAGILVFLISGWGMIMSGFKAIGQKFWDTCYNVIFGGENNIKDDEIINLIDNIETMGYDLYGYGFMASADSDADGNQRYYEENNNGNKKLIESLEDKDAYRYLTTYLISDNYAYYIKNHNLNFRAMMTDKKHFLGGIFEGTVWGSGLISIYEQAGENDKITGIRGTVYGSLSDKALNGATLGAFAGTIIPGIRLRC